MIDVGTRIKSVSAIVSDNGEPLREGSVLTIGEPNFFGVGFHLAFDSGGRPWAIDESSIDSKNSETNDFTVMENVDA